MIPNLIGTYLCGAKNGKKICYRIFDCREMGVEVLEVTALYLLISCFNHDHENFEMCGVLNANYGL